MMLPNGVLRFIQDFNSCTTINEEQKQYRLYLSTELSFLRQRRVCYFRDFNNLNISIKSLSRNLLSKGFILCINFQLLKTIGAVHKVRHARGGGGPRRCDSLRQ